MKWRKGNEGTSRILSDKLGVIAIQCGHQMMCIWSRKPSMVQCDRLWQASRSRGMYDNERIMCGLFECLFVWVMVNRLMRQPLVEGLDDNVPHITFFQDMIDLGLGCTEQGLAFGGLEQR